ncbi:esterase/lipase family protein [Vibrio splendidus]|nr:triacylglycerol lipase [Vibrio splendidus]MCC4880343.1 triacylglycerol lipase [Vibrio splendidus]
MGNIILIHGLYMHGLVMMPMAKRFKSLGYKTKCLSYNSVKINESLLFSRIDDAIDHNTANYLVGHSLGGVMIKRYLKSRNLSLDVMPKVAIIGSPINGAQIVRRIRGMNLDRMLGNAPNHGLEPSEGAWDAPQKLISIAGSVNVGVGTILLDRKMESDGTVMVKETKIEGMTEHCVLRCNHTSLIYSMETARKIHNFIQQHD